MRPVKGVLLSSGTKNDPSPVLAFWVMFYS